MRPLPTALAAPLVACAFLAGPLPAQTHTQDDGHDHGQDPPVIDTTPSDPAALGFLRGFVDERLLHLPAQGVTMVEGVARVLMTSAVGVQERITYTVGINFATAELKIAPVGRIPDLAPRWRQVADQAAANILETQTPLSDIASNYVVRLARDKDEVRLTLTPRDKRTHFRLTFWFRQDGTLLRKQEAHVMAEGKPPEVTDTVFVLKEHEGRLYIQETSRTLRRETCKARFEYQNKNGVLVLRKLFLDGVMDVNPETGVPFRQPITVEVEYEVDVTKGGAP